MNRNINLPILDNVTSVKQINDMIRTFINVIKEVMRHNIPRKLYYSSWLSFPNYLRDIIQLRNIIRRNWERNSVIFSFKRLNSMISEENISIRTNLGYTAVHTG